MGGRVLWFTIILSLSGIVELDFLSAQDLATLYRKEIPYSKLDLSIGKDDTLAVANEWVRMTGRVETGSIGRDSLPFLNFLKGRLRVLPPDWWCYEIRHGNVFRNEVTFFGCKKSSTMWKGDRPGPYYSGIDELHETPSGLRLRHGKAVIFLNENDFSPLNTDADEHWKIAGDRAIACAVGHDVCLITLGQISGSGGPRSLYCADAHSSKPIWSRQLDGGLPTPFASSGEAVISYTEIIVYDDRVAVWTIHQFGAVLDVLNKTDGSSIASFVSARLEGVRIKDK